MTETPRASGWLASGRLVLVGIVVVIVVPSLAFIIAAIGQSVSSERAETAPAALSSSGECVTCHQRTTPRHRRTVQTQQHGGGQCQLPELPRGRGWLSRFAAAPWDEYIDRPDDGQVCDMPSGAGGSIQS